MLPRTGLTSAWLKDRISSDAAFIHEAITAKRL
jgi:hypothetical protein